MAAQHVQARQCPARRAWDAVHRQHRLHLRGAEGARALAALARQLPRGVPGRHARPRRISWATSDRTRRNIGRAASAVPTFTRWRGSAPIPTQGREEATRIIRAEMEATGGVEIRFVQDTMALAHENGIGSEGEHFGFADPISQPPIEGADAPSYPGDGVLEADGTLASAEAGRVPARLRGRGRPRRHAGARAVRAAAERHVHGVPQALPGRGGVSPLPGDGREGALRFRRPRPPGPGRGQDDGPLAQRLPGRPVARQGRSRDRGRSRSGATTSPMQATTRACAARSVRTCAAPTRARRR